MKQRVYRGKRAVKAAAIFAAVFLAFTWFCAPGSLGAHAAVQETQFDGTAIEEDLKGVDLSAYPKNASGTHRLLDGVGFAEYGYSERSALSEELFGIYFYIYNPTERALSERPGAHVVNMAIAWNEDGLPTDYANLSLTLLDATDNNRFLKMKLTNGEGAYERAKAYAAEHGVRRYDFAGLQLWFVGDRNATDSNAIQSGGGHSYGASFLCSGYAEGCAAPGAPSSLVIVQEELETVTLELEHTFYRTETSALGVGHQNQIDTVYFSVPKQFFDKYGKLQRIKAEWYEYRTRPIVVTSNKEFYEQAKDYVGIDLSRGKTKDNLGLYDIDSNIEYGLATDVADLDGMYGATWGWNLGKGYLHDPTDTIYYLFPTKNWTSVKDYDPYSEDIEGQGGVSGNRLEDWIFHYTPGTGVPSWDSGFGGGGGGSFDEGMDGPGIISETGLPVKDGTIPSVLFEEDIDESRKIENDRGKVGMGYSYYDFDADLDLQSWVSWSDTKPGFWDKWISYGFWNALTNNVPQETGKTVAPIQVLTKESSENMLGDGELSDELLIHSSDAAAFKEYCNDAFTVKGEGDEEKYVVLFRFAVTDYVSKDANIIQFGAGFLGHDKAINGEAYIAQQEVFLDFDVIQLTFNNSGNMKVIPVVSSPIDIVNPVTTPNHVTEDMLDWNLVWWLVGTIAGLAVLFVGTAVVDRKIGKGGSHGE